MYFLETIDQRRKEEKENKLRRKRNNPIPNAQYNDANNNENCQFDGGDCCLDPVNTNYCSECVCHEDGLIHYEPPTEGTASPHI